MVSIFDHIKHLTRITVDKIYGSQPNSISSYSSPWACKAIFQSLSDIAKCTVMKIILLKSDFDEKISEDFTVSSETSFLLEDIIDCWLNPKNENNKSLSASIASELINMRIIIPINEKNNGINDNIIEEISLLINNREIRYIVNPFFQMSFLASLSKASEPWKDISKSNEYSYDTIAIDFLDKFSSSRWNSLLCFLVEIKDEDSEIKFDSNAISVIEAFTKKACLMNEGSITVEGYEFLLKNYRDQVWEFVLEVISFTIYVHIECIQ